MTLQTILNGELIIPPVPDDLVLAISGKTITGGSGHAFGAIFRAPKAGDIREIHFKINTVTSSGTIDVRLETVSLVNGDPTGTLVDTNSNNSSTFSATGWTTSGDFGGNATVTKGQLIAVVFDAGTFDGAIEVTENQFPASSNQTTAYSSLFNGSTWTKDNLVPMMAIEYSSAGDIVPVHGLYAWSSRANTVFNSSDSIDEYALKFQLSVPSRLAGMWVELEADGDVEIIYYGTGTTAIAGGTISLDTNTRFGDQDTIFYADFPSPHLLDKNTDYRIGVKPGASDISIQIFTYDTVNADMIKGDKGGANFSLSTRADGGAWSEEAAKKIWLGILLDQLDDAVGGGGGLLVHPNMTGGING